MKDAKTGEEKTVVVDTDEGVRAGTTPEALAKLKPAFKADGSTTAGNASQVRTRSHTHSTHSLTVSSILMLQSSLFFFSAVLIDSMASLK